MLNVYHPPIPHLAVIILLVHLRHWLIAKSCCYLLSRENPLIRPPIQGPGQPKSVVVLFVERVRSYLAWLSLDARLPMTIIDVKVNETRWMV